MAVVYFDSSALVKLFIEEPGSELAALLWDGCDLPVSSRLAYPEVCAALAAAARNLALTTRGLERAVGEFREFWSAIRPLELTREVARHAGYLARAHALRGADAVHLASALVLGDDMIMAVWDRRLHAGAVEAGCNVAPARLDA